MPEEIQPKLTPIEILRNSIGLSAIFLPDMYDVTPMENKPLSEEEALARMNAFLDQLNKIGVDVKAVIDVQVPLSGRFGAGGSREKKMAIVKR